MKQHLLILFGGRSSEHDISLKSAANVARAVDTERYDLLLAGITKEGRWHLADGIASISDGTYEQGPACMLSADTSKKCLYVFGENGSYETVPVDVIFPVLHGLYGEDGTVQGLFELSGIPYVGPGVLASAVSMDKVYTKVIVDRLHIRQAAYIWVGRGELEDMDRTVEKIERKLAYPVFVKPSCAGSSIGVNQAFDRRSLEAALKDAAVHDAKILIEETIVGRELETAVFENGGEVTVSGVGEILSAAEFYDFDAKYNNAESKTVVDPLLPDPVREELRKDAEMIFRAVGACGLSRVDFFLDEKGVVFNEINTLPGFTAISMYPMLMERIGIGKRELVQRLIDSAYHRNEH